MSSAWARTRQDLLAPATEWNNERLADPHQVLEQRTARSAQTRRNLLGPISLELVTLDIGRPSYRAITSLEAALALIRAASALASKEQLGQDRSDFSSRCC